MPQPPQWMTPDGALTDMCRNRRRQGTLRASDGITARDRRERGRRLCCCSSNFENLVRVANVLMMPAARFRRERSVYGGVIRLRALR